MICIPVRFLFPQMLHFIKISYLIIQPWVVLFLILLVLFLLYHHVKKKFSIDIDSSTFDPHISDHEPSSQGNDLIHTPPPILDSEIPLGRGPPNHDQFISDKSHSNTNHDHATLTNIPITGHEHNSNTSNTSMHTTSNTDTSTHTHLTIKMLWECLQE